MNKIHLNKFTLGTTYYNNPEYLSVFVEKNLKYVNELIVVDDGSPDPITNYLSPSEKIRIFRVKKDYGFNSHGCRNLIMKKAYNDWVILLDIDREFLFPEQAFSLLHQTQLKPKFLHRFIAHSHMDEAHISVNDYLIHRDHFFSAGGYDEEIIGQRWGDREYFKQLSHFGCEKVLYGVDIILTRRPSILLKVNSRNDILRTEEHQRLVDKRTMAPEPNKPILTFEWEEIK